MIRHLLVTNDFPPKVGGIQSYLWELWRRLPPADVVVLTTPQRGAASFDATAPMRIERTRQPVLLPTPWLVRHIRRLAAETGAELVVLDPALPLGLIGPRLGLPYALVLHGAEVTVPGRLPVTRPLLSSVIRRANQLIAAGPYPAAEASRAGRGRLPPVTIVPPGVDVDRFVPLDPPARAAARASFGLPPEGRLVVSVSRLVPRKGMDVLIKATHQLAAGRPDLTVAIAGAGRDRPRLERLVRSTGAPVRLLGRVADGRLPDLYGCADVFAMCCRDRWAGLEQEGFGIVFLEAAACAVAQVAGDSGGAADAVEDPKTGLVVRRPGDPAAVASVLADLLDDADRRSRLGAAARERVERDFAYDVLAQRLREALDTMADRPRMG